MPHTLSIVIALALAPLTADAASIQQLQFLGAGTTLPGIAGNLIRSLFGLAGTIALVMFVLGGFTIMTSEGNEEKVKKGRAMLTNAVIGLLAMFFSYSALSFVISALSAAA